MTTANADALDAAIPSTAAQTPPPAAVVGTSSRVLPQYETVSIEDEAAASRADLDFYKGRKNVTDRLGVLDLKHIACARAHYQEGLGFILCRSKFTRQVTSGPDGKNLYAEVMTEKAGCCDMLGEAAKKFAVPVIHYSTTPKGDLVKPLAFTLKVWRFATERFANLQQLHLEFKESGGLATHDVKFNCTDDGYQKGTIVGCADSIVAHPKFQEQHGAGLANWIQVVSGELKRAIARDMTDEELRKKIGEGGPTAQTLAPEAGPVSSLDDLLK